MSILIFLLAGVIAYQAFKRSSPAGITLAVMLALISYGGKPGVGVLEFLVHLLAQKFLPFLVLVAVVYGVSYAALWLFGKMKRGGPAAQALISDPAPFLKDMKVVVGRVLDTKSSSTVFSNVSIGRDAFGGIQANTSHDVEVTHNTWLLDLNTNREVNYSGGGELRARAGHILGTMSWRGHNLIDTNFSTGQEFIPPKESANVVRSVFSAALLVFLGWIVFPALGLVAPLVWLGWVNWNGNAGALVSNVAPGAHRIEALLIYGGGIAYLIAGFLLAGAGNNMGSVFLPIAGSLFVLFFFLHQRVVREVSSRYSTLIEVGKAEIQRLYQQAEEKQRAQAAASAPTEPAAPSPVA